ncbi:hypothetical protein D3C78_1209650 [compost metagenome]
MPRVRRVELTAQAPQHVIGVEFASGREVVGLVELHPLAQVESVGQAVRRDVPAFGQCRLDVGGTGLEVDQAVEQRFGGGIEGDPRSVLDNVEPFRAGLGAHYQRLGCQLCGAAQYQRCQGEA